jgi:hypothetical protein
MDSLGSSSFQKVYRLEDAVQAYALLSINTNGCDNIQERKDELLKLDEQQGSKETIKIQQAQRGNQVNIHCMKQGKDLILGVPKSWFFTSIRIDDWSIKFAMDEAFRFQGVWGW